MEWFEIKGRNTHDAGLVMHDLEKGVSAVFTVEKWLLKCLRLLPT